jgi:hypothetical protein
MTPAATTITSSLKRKLDAMIQRIIDSSREGRAGGGGPQVGRSLPTGESTCGRQRRTTPRPPLTTPLRGRLRWT